MLNTKSVGNRNKKSTLNDKILKYFTNSKSQRFEIEGLHEHRCEDSTVVEITVHPHLLY